MKSILIIGPRFFSYEKFLRLELSRLGYNSVFLDERLNTFFEKSLVRIGIKIFFRRKNFSRILRFIESNEHSFDEILFISPETTGHREMMLIKNSYPNARLILYMWDSLKNKKASSLIKYFDKCITFDYIDYVSNDKFEFLPLYFNPEHYKKMDLPVTYDICLCCSLHSDRYELFLKLKELSKQKNLNFYYHIYVKNRLLLIYFQLRLFLRKLIWVKAKYITFPSLSPLELNELYNRSNSVVDLNHPLQNGLTNRTFEVLATNAKLITTNKSISKYDFYNIRQILLIQRESINIPDEFIENKKTYINLEEYTLNSWIKNILR